MVVVAVVVVAVVVAVVVVVASSWAVLIKYVDGSLEEECQSARLKRLGLEVRGRWSGEVSEGEEALDKDSAVASIVLRSRWEETDVPVGSVIC